MSVYGDVSVNYISASGKVIRVGGVKGLAVYTPNIKRRFHLVLINAPDVNYRTGKLKVVYADQSSRAVTLAEGETVLN